MSDTFGEACGIWPLLLYDTPFLDACIWHDKSYTENSWAERKIPQEQTDHWFLTQMLVIAGRDEFLQTEAYFFYRVARILGAHWWEGGRYYAPAGVLEGVVQRPGKDGETLITIPKDKSDFPERITGYLADEPDPQP